MDKITETRILTLHPAIRDVTTQIINECEAKHINVRVTQALRTWSEQDELYTLGRGDSVAKIVTNARGGQSWHNYGLAWDFCLLSTDGKTAIWNRNIDLSGDGKSTWMDVVTIAMSHGFEWGGDWKTFKDYPHLEKTFNLTLDEARSLYMAKSFDDEGYIII